MLSCPHETWTVFVTIDNMAIPIDATLTTVVNDPSEGSLFEGAENIEEVHQPRQRSGSH